MTLYYSHPASLGHDTGAHPENAARIRAIEARLGAAGWPGLERREAPAATREQLERVHDRDHIDRLERFCASGGGWIDADTYAMAASWEAALRASGAACEAAERLLGGEAEAAFCALRPPGHHAERDRAMGFCLLDHVAIAAAHALAAGGVERVLVVDWDVHHGNGIESIFSRSRSVLYASIHQWPFYPATGSAAYEGEGEGLGYTVNLPVPAGTGPDGFLAMTEHVIVPIAHRYRPGLIVVAAGFDAHAADPLAACELDAACYGDMTAALRDAATELEAPLLISLEGGYDPVALADSVLETVLALGDRDRRSRPAPIEAAAPHRSRLAARWKL